VQFVITVVKHGNLKKMFNWTNTTYPIFVDTWSDECYNNTVKLLEEQKQVCLFLKIQKSETEHNEMNAPYYSQKVVGEIISSLGKLEYVEGHQYIIIETPNIENFYNA